MKTLFRCDATADTGFGHLSRCIALAEAFALSDVESVFVGMFDPAARDQLGEAGFECAGLSAPLGSKAARDELGGRDADCIVLDSYRADADYLAQLDALGSALVVIDDFRALHAYPCDAILNFTWEAPSLGYPEGPALLLGPNYLLTRRKLVETRVRSMTRARKGRVRKLLVAVGGSDPKGITARLLRVLGTIAGDVQVRTISAEPEKLAPGLAAFADGSEALPRQPDLSEQLLWADAAITGGGLIKYEAAFMGLPAAAIAQNEGQDGETQDFAAAGLVYDLGLADKVSDGDLAKLLECFLTDDTLRERMAGRMKDAFVPDPSARAARAILKATGPRNDR
ncbi:PseG/SpsG family protein [Qipengyuania nanhaisediminis]|uniref:PseG/SpsG family protein n=1 Tax=Qipengyuania nanhaisediminis TaxID=604088 RepID=UPI0038B23451